MLGTSPHNVDMSTSGASFLAFHLNGKQETTLTVYAQELQQLLLYCVFGPNK
jgi:hypothetical protein